MPGLAPTPLTADDVLAGPRGRALCFRLLDEPVGDQPGKGGG